MKKIFGITLLVLLLALTTALAAFAADDFYSVTDSADLLTEAQWKQLNARAEAITEKYGCEVAVVTVDDMYEYDVDYAYDDGDAYVFNKALYNELGFGYGSDKSCLLLCLSMDDRDYWLEPYGYAKTAFTAHGIDVMIDKHVLPLLKSDKYYEAFSAYLDKAEEYLEMARDGEPFEKNNDPDVLRANFIGKLFAVILLPALIALIICLIWKGQMKTAKIARTADNYIPEGGFRLTGRTDTFLYRTTTRRKIERSSSSGGSSRGSSGRGGKF